MTPGINTSTNSIETPPPIGAERRILVLISIAVVSVMFVGMVALLYLRERPAPSALLVMRVPPAQDGAIATIDAKDRDLAPIITTLQGGQEVRIPLPPGEYIVKIEHPTKRIRHELILSDYSYYPLLLDKPPATGPTSKGNAKR